MKLLKAALALGLALGGAALGLAPPAGAATSLCTVSYTIVSSWPGGFQASIAVTNNGAALTGWALGFRLTWSRWRAAEGRSQDRVLGV